MAGIGFSLKRLFGKKGFLSLCRAYGYAGIICAGPMILGVILLAGMALLSRRAGVPAHERELLNCMLTYSLLVSLTVTSWLNMTVTRFTSDMLYEERPERILPSFYGSLAIMLPAGGILYGGFLLFSGVPFLYQALCLWFALVLIVVWTEMIYLTALKDYKGIVIAFAVSLAAGFAAAALAAALGAASVPVLMLCVILAYGFLMVWYYILLLNYFPEAEGSRFLFLGWLDRYRSLALVGGCVNIGLFSHLVIMYFGPLKVRVEGLFYGAPLHDVPALLAYFSILVTTINFVTSVEVRFYPKYRNYYSLFNDNGTIGDIAQAEREMLLVLRRELAFNGQKQLISTILFVVCGSFLMRWTATGDSDVSLGIFRFLCAGYGVYAVGNTLMLILLYFEDYAGALMAAAAFAVVATAATILQVLYSPVSFFGLGFSAGGMLFCLIAWLRLEWYARRLPYFLLCRQAVTPQEESGFFTRLSGRLESRHQSRKTGSSRKRSRGAGSVSGMLLGVMLLTLFLSGCAPEAGKTGARAGESSVVSGGEAGDRLHAWEGTPDRRQDDGLVGGDSAGDSAGGNSAGDDLAGGNSADDLAGGNSAGDLAGTDSADGGSGRRGDVVLKALPTEEGHLKDRTELYESGRGPDVVKMYLTVRRGNADDHTDHTWREVSFRSTWWYEEHGLARSACEAVLRIGDEFGVGETVPNAVVQVRGQTSSGAAQKSYRVRIRDGKGSWRGQRTLALNKHVADPVRFRNRIACELMAGIPQMMSARTQFVRLYVKDETGEGSEEEAEFEDYGLFTQVEQINRTYLKNHGLDRGGLLYKANFFEWRLYDEIMAARAEYDAADAGAQITRAQGGSTESRKAGDTRMQSDNGAAYDRAAFERYLEIKGADDHRRLLDLLEKVNSYTVPIDEIIEQNFDSQNICYWLAFHILTGNYDVGARNFYLYSPRSAEKWYFISWDNDASFSRTYYEGKKYKEGFSWERGLTQFVHCVLFERMFREKKYRKELDAAVEDLRRHALAPDRVGALADRFAAVVKPFVYRMPDMAHKRVGESEYDRLVRAMPQEIGMNYRYYRESLKKPWPFYVGVPEADGKRTDFTWEAAYNPGGGKVTYSFWLAKDCEFTQILEKREGLKLPQTSAGRLKPGKYFVRVRAKNEDGYEQDCFDYYLTERGKVYGTKCFYVNRDGTATDRRE